MNADNSFTFRGISETQKNTYEYLNAYGTGFVVAGRYNLNAAANPQGVNGITTDWGVQSFTGLINYGYQNKLYTDLSLRYEGNSRFSSDNRWGTFWSAGLAYILTEEEFFQHLNWLDYLRARVSSGKTGNADIGLNQNQPLAGFGTCSNIPSLVVDQRGTPGLSWDTAYSRGLALEFEVLHFLNGGVTYLPKNSTALLC